MTKPMATKNPRPAPIYTPATEAVTEITDKDYFPMPDSIPMATNIAQQLFDKAFWLPTRLVHGSRDARKELSEGAGSTERGCHS